MRVGAADVAVQRHPALVGHRLGRRERHAEDRVRAEPALGVGAVERAELGVEHPLVGRVEPDDRVADLAVHVRDGVLHTLAAVAQLAVAELDRLVGAGAGAARDRGPAPGARGQLDLDLDGRVAARVQDLPPGDVVNDAHMNSCGQCCECSGSNRGNGGERAFVAWHRRGRTPTLGNVTRRIVAAFLGVVAILLLTPDRLSGEPTTTTGFFPTGQPPSPLSLYARRPGAKYEDVEARPRATVDLGLTQVAVVSWSIQPHARCPAGRYRPVCETEKLGLVDSRAERDENGGRPPASRRPHDPAGVILPTLSCAVTTADDGTVLLAYDRPPPPARSTTSAHPAPHNVDLYFPLGAHRGRVYVTCRNSFFDAPVGNTRAVWGIDV